MGYGPFFWIKSLNSSLTFEECSVDHINFFFSGLSKCSSDSDNTGESAVSEQLLPETFDSGVSEKKSCGCFLFSFGVQSEYLIFGDTVAVVGFIKSGEPKID